MKRFSAQYVFTNSGSPLRRAVINTEDDGTIISIENNEGQLKEERSIEFFNGIIIPGFVNCHCHLEYSYQKGIIAEGNGLHDFISQIRKPGTPEERNTSAVSADHSMFCEGIVLCADVCNTSDTFALKKESKIKYINFIEVFGLNPAKAGFLMEKTERIAETAREMGLPYSIVPHAPYSMSISLLRLLRKATLKNRITSIHFMESASEEPFLKQKSGKLMDVFEKAGLIPDNFEIVQNHEDLVLKEITASGNLILVHNTFADGETIKNVKKRKNLYWCVCPASNLYIEKRLPDLKMLIREGCEIVIGTDSLASNKNLSILNELKLIGQNFPDIGLESLIMWSSHNGAEALNESEYLGSIEPGKKPGLLLLQNVDLHNLKLLADSYVTRLI